MNKISSFTIDHTKLEPGIYVSRINYVGDNKVYTYDIRLLKPNIEPVMDTGAIHAIEHLGATYIRMMCGYEVSNNCIYFGPMGCRTGFYYITTDFLNENERTNFFKNLFNWIVEYDGEIPGASPKECGNYSDMSLTMAKYYAKMFLDRIKSFGKNNFNYTYIEE